mmetsp:Transcript_29167/g.61999  ORF Transcript_29167/g.61999 Transcript_29167/m.61999 type:complete len:304 (+) Transcript_29167:182-1093(+)
MVAGQCADVLLSAQSLQADAAAQLCHRSAVVRCRLPEPSSPRLESLGGLLRTQASSRRPSSVASESGVYGMHRGSEPGRVACLPCAHGDSTTICGQDALRLSQLVSTLPRCGHRCKGHTRHLSLIASPLQCQRVAAMQGSHQQLLLTKLLHPLPRRTNGRLADAARCRLFARLPNLGDIPATHGHGQEAHLPELPCALTCSCHSGVADAASYCLVAVLLDPLRICAAHGRCEQRRLTQLTCTLPCRIDRRRTDGGCLRIEARTLDGCRVAGSDRSCQQLGAPHHCLQSLRLLKHPSHGGGAEA